MFKLVLCVIFLLACLNITHCFNPCGEWTEFKDNKCVKVLGEKATKNDALHKCTELEMSSTLLTINSRAEQEFLDSLLTQYNNVSENVWIGLTLKNSSYVWPDGTAPDNITSNWEEQEVRSLHCVTMSLGMSNLGQWSDQKCTRLALVVCQKKKQLDLNGIKVLTDSLNKLEEEVKNLKEETNSLIPLGFIYTQLPNQSSPHALWPKMNWEEITENYSGLFFRAEGKGSNEFGQIQQGDFPRISNIRTGSFEVKDATANVKTPYDFPLKEDSSTDIHPGGLLYQLIISVTKVENRPRNTAVRIWKRVEWPR